MTNILENIVLNKKDEVRQRKIDRPLDSFIDNLTLSNRSFDKALSNTHSDFILECKKASPSKGLIREDFNLDKILTVYQDYASAISVLTDEKYFQGSFDYLLQASQTVKQPILCKDFFIDAYQVFEARFYGADAILLMLSVLSDDEYKQLAEIAVSLNLDVLTEIHDQKELERALFLNAKIIGINNRNLKDLSINLQTTELLAKQIPSDRIVISESGIKDNFDVRRLSPLVNGFLVGSSIMQHQDIRSQCKNLIYGNIKICGITRIQDAISVDKNGGSTAGFIFHPKSKRFVSLDKALKISQQVPLNYVGVFVDKPIDDLINYTKKLGLYAVQLHGSESAEYIAKLKQALPAVKIWKAVHIKDKINFVRDSQVDHYLLDTFSQNEQGGSGLSFDWDLLDLINPTDIILAGGINSNNIQKAVAYKPFAIDLSSGVELSPGIKCAEKLSSLFKQLRT